MRRHNTTLASYYIATWWVVLFLAFLLVCLSRALPIWLGILGFALCAWVVAPEFIGRSRVPKPHYLFIFAYVTLFLAFGLFNYRDGKRVIPLLVTSIAALIPIFLSRGQRAFGVWIAFMTVSLMAVVGVILSSRLAEYGVFVVFLVFLLLNINAANLVEIAGKNASRYLPLPKGHLRQFAPSLGWGFVLAALVFLFFPRKPALNNPFGFREKGEEAGYTGSVTLKNESKMNSYTQLALTVESADVEWLKKVGPELLFRGNVLEKFDGVQWSSENSGALEYRPDIDLRYTLSYHSAPHKLKIFREMHHTRAVIYPGILASIQANTKLLSGLYYDRNGNLTRGHSENIRYSYELLIVEPEAPALPADLTIAGYSNVLSSRRILLDLDPEEAHLQTLLSLPYQTDGNGAFANWIREVGVDREKSTIAQAVARLGRHFSEKFEPTLQYKLSSDNGFESFISKDRKGHCEYFATATALYLRALGVPTRLVLGYRGGKFNPVSKVLEVSEASAHAWAEYYVPRYGWIGIDLTPTVPEEAPSKLEALLTIYLGAAKFWANHYLVDYNDMSQRQLVKSLAAAKTYGLSSWRTPDFVKPSTGFIVVAFLVLFQIIKIIMRHSRRRRALQSLPEYYLRFLKAMEKRAFTRKTGETFAQFHLRLIAAGVDGEVVRRFSKAIERDLYAATPTQDLERRWLLQKGLT